MKHLFLFSILTFTSFGQDSGLIQQMVQGCLSDSTFQSNLYLDDEIECKEFSSYTIPYNFNLKLSLNFQGVKLKKHNYSDSSLCNPLSVSVYQKSNSKYNVTVSLNTEVPLKCEHLEGHGKGDGCVSNKVVSINRVIKVKRNGEVKIKKSENRSYYYMGTFL